VPFSNIEESEIGVQIANGDLRREMYCAIFTDAY
jgi:hypothetical protein